MLSYVVFSAPGGSLLANWSLQVRDLQIETTPRGYGTCTARIPMNDRQMRWWFTTLENAHLVIRDNGRLAYEGRIEVVETAPDGLLLTAFGYSRAYSDLAVSDMWSTMSVAEWVPVTTDMATDRAPDLYEMDTDNRIFIGLQKGTTYAGTGAADLGTMQYTLSALSGVGVQRFAGTYAMLLPTNWRCTIEAYGGGLAGALLLTLTGTGVLQSAAFNFTTLGGRTIIVINVFNNTGAPVTFAGENGSNYVKLTGIRIAAGTGATITADEVVRTLVARVSAANPLQASSITARVKSPGFDLKEYRYSQVNAEDVLDELARLGGDGWLWNWRVWADQILIYDRTANGGQTFQIYTTPPVSRDLGTLRTSMIPVYTDAIGNEVAGTTQTNTTAESRTRLKRSAYFSAPTTSATDAASLAAAALVDASVVNAHGDITVTELWQNGQRVPLTAVRSGDTIQCLEFPATGNSETDKTRSFRIATTQYDHTGRTVTLSPEQRAPRIDSLLARRDVSLVGR